MEQENNKKPDKLPTISSKHEAVVHTWFKNGFNIKNAYLTHYKGITPGTAEAQGSKLLKLPQVQAFIAALQDQIRASENIDKAEIIKTLKRTIAKAEEDNDHANVIKASAELAKIGGLYKDKPDINIAAQGEIQISFGGWNPDVDAQVSNYINDNDYTEEIDSNQSPL